MNGCEKKGRQSTNIFIGIEDHYSIFFIRKCAIDVYDNVRTSEHTVPRALWLNAYTAKSVYGGVGCPCTQHTNAYSWDTYTFDNIKANSTGAAGIAWRA